MTLSSIVEIDRRFARSARVDADLKGHPPLVGYVMQASIAKALTAMATSQVDSGQGAFTWTGPYGGGKSSAALLIANLIGGVGDNRRIAREIVGDDLVDLFARAFPEDGGPWTVVPVTGSRLALRDIIAHAARDALKWPKATFERAMASDDGLVSALLKSAETGRSGVLLILDELGKLLEHAVADDNDIHLLQDLGERSARSDGRLVVLGILHQAFDQYAVHASRDARKEWKKVQGRYQDLAILAGADETVALLARAIRCEQRPPSAAEQAGRAAAAVALRRPTDTDLLSVTLAQTWPLNPVTTLLLGPLSRQRFAQNERSVFGFLASAEPAGFDEHLKTTHQDHAATTYDPDQLWDYLAANFGMALTGGPDGARFSLAFEAIDRAAAKGSDLHVALTKAAAVIEFFRNGSGLSLADDFLRLAVPHHKEDDVRTAIAQLVEWAILMRQPRLGGYALFAGSDFDLDEAVGKVVSKLDAEQLTTLPTRVGLGFATAKRHYFRTGALRTFEIMLVLVGKGDTGKLLGDRVASRPARGSGKLALLLSDGTLDAAEVEALCKSVAKALKRAGRVVAVGGANNSYTLRPNAAELFAVERVSREHPQLEGDRIARRELSARHSACLDAVKRDLEAALNGARWWLAPQPQTSLAEPLSIVATVLADAAYDEAPVLKSELLQRDKPSSNAMAAVRDLCHAMVARGEEAQLGFSGYPAALGLYRTVLEPFGLHREVDDTEGFDFFGPNETEAGRSLMSVWALMEEPAEFTLGEIYRQWARPPIGLKAGLMPVLALANILARRDRLAVYVEDQFQTRLEDIFVDKLLQNPDQIRLRRIDRSAREANFLEGLAHRFGLPADGASLPVAQALYQRFEALPTYAQRTEALSDVSIKVRNAVLKSKDPERMFFEALPDALDEALSAEVVFNAVLEAEGAYPALTERLKAALAAALGTDQDSFSGLTDRVTSIKGLTNDWAFEAFAMRAAAFEHGEGDIEGLASLLLHRSPRTWSDRDCDQAFTELAGIGRKFRELEALATVRQRPSQAEALALIVGLDHGTPPTLASFVLTDMERDAADGLAGRLIEILAADPGLHNVRLAALARAVANVASTMETA